MGECPFEEGDLLALITEGSSRAVLVSGLHVRRQLQLDRDVHVVFPRVGMQGGGLVYIPGGRGGGGVSLNTLHLLLHSP